MIAPAALLLLASPLLAAAANHEGGGPAHRQRAALSRAAAPAVELDARDIELVQEEKRGNSGASGARFTYYDTSVGLGSCGVFHPNSEFTVALNSGQLNAAGGGYPNPLCGSMITISYNGKTTQASIQDECPTCPWGGLDLSAGLFSFFADHGAGVIYGDWWYGGGAPAAPAPKPDPTTTTPAWTPDPTTTTPEWVAPTTTHKAWTPDPTTTTKEWVPPTTTTPAWTPDPTTSSVAPTTSSAAPPTTSSAAATTSSAAVSSSEESVPPATLSGLKNAAPTASAAPAAINNLEALGSFANGLGRVVCNGNENCA